jgi:hypothetical protein
MIKKSSDYVSSLSIEQQGQKLAKAKGEGGLQIQIERTPVRSKRST